MGNIRFNYSKNHPGHFTVYNPNKSTIKKLCNLSKLENYSFAGNFFNFDLPSTLINNKLFPLRWSSLPLIKGRVALENTSFNPTGEPHLGNLHLYFHGSVMLNILRLSGGNVDNLYYINDLGDRFKNLSKENRDKKIALNMSSIIEKLSKFPYKLPEIFLRESYFLRLAEKTIMRLSNLKKIGKGLAILKDGKPSYFLRKRNSGEPTYFLNDLSYHTFLDKLGYSFIINSLGNDHKGHVDKMRDSMREIGCNLKNIFFLIGKITLRKNGETQKLSKRKGVVTSIPIMEKNWRKISLSLSSREDHILSETSLQALFLNWKKIDVAFLRSKNFTDISLKNPLNPLIFISTLEDLIVKAYEQKDISLIFKAMIQLSDIVNDGPYDKISWVNLRRAFLFLKSIFG